MRLKEKKADQALAAGGIGCFFFIIVFLIEGAVRPGYSVLRHPISSLSLGPEGWLQQANFIITGVLLFCLAFGLHQKRGMLVTKTWAPVLFCGISFGLIGSGIFSTDAINGYPPGTPMMIGQQSLHGQLHVLSSLLVFIALPALCFIFRRWFRENSKRGWSIYSHFTGILVIAGFALSGTGFNQVAVLVDYAGLFQRIGIFCGFSWMGLLAFYLRRNSLK